MKKRNAHRGKRGNPARRGGKSAPHAALLASARKQVNAPRTGLTAAAITHLPSYDRDDRQALLLLLAPFLILACALGAQGLVRAPLRLPAFATPSIADKSSAIADARPIPAMPALPPDAPRAPAGADTLPSPAMPVSAFDAEPGRARIALRRAPAPVRLVDRMPPLARAHPFGADVADRTPRAPLGLADPEGAASLAQKPAIPRMGPLGPADPEGLASLQQTPPQRDFTARGPADPEGASTITHAHLARPAIPVAATPLLTVPPGPIQCHATSRARPVPKSLSAATSGEAFGLRLAAAAAEQLDEFVIYNATYSRIAYPMGDVSSLFGVCTDVVVRAYRRLGIDLQVLIHTARMGLGDPNIDHRRVEVMRKFLARFGQSLPVTRYPEDYLPGDIVTYYRPQNSSSNSHIAIVSDRMAPSGRLMILHNRGWGPQLEDALFVDQITGHYRYAGPAPLLAARKGPARGRGRAAFAAGQAEKTDAVPFTPIAAPMSRGNIATPASTDTAEPAAMCRLPDGGLERPAPLPPTRHARAYAGPAQPIVVGATGVAAAGTN
ncbi:MAG: DUF1287 domain-containing protein [Hyphomicrobiaceae bacterium]